MRTERVPLADILNQRLGSVITTTDGDIASSKDVFLKNVMFEQKTDKMYVVKRPGLNTIHDETDGRGSGIYVWQGKVYALIDQTLYQDGTSIDTAMPGGNVIAQFAEEHKSDLLIIKRGDSLETVNDSFTVTAVNDADLPTSLVPGIVSLDTYIFVMNSDGEIYNSDLDDVTAWTSGSFVTAKLDADDGVGLAKYRNYVVALGAWTTEFFFNAANASGSPLDPVEGSVLAYGCANGNTVFSDENTLIWLAQSRSGIISVVKLDGLNAVPLSTPYIEKIVQAAIGASSEYVLNSVHFDGSNDFLTRGADLTGNADGDAGTVSLWIRTQDVGPSAGHVAIYGCTVNNGLRVVLRPSGKIAVLAENSGGTTLLDISSSISINDDAWHHIMASWDLSASVAHLYVDGVDRLTTTTLTSGTIDYTDTDHGVARAPGATADTDNTLEADLAQLYINTAEYVDLSSSANRALFYNNGPVDLGSDGSTPTGNAPIMFFNGDTATWHTNDGTGEGFTENGAITTGSAISASKTYAFGFRANGHLFYCLVPNIENNWMLVCDVNLGAWYFWEFPSNDLPVGAATDTSGSLFNVFLLAKESGKVFRLEEGTYQDDSSSIEVEIVTDKVDLQTRRNKFLHSLGVIGDEQTSACAVSVSWSDDDYRNFSTARDVDMEDGDPALYQCGRFKRRAFKLTHAADTPLRLEALELGVEIGDYEGGNT